MCLKFHVPWFRKCAWNSALYCTRKSQGNVKISWCRKCTRNVNFPRHFIAQEIQDFFQCLLFLIARFILIITLTLLQNFVILGAQAPPWCWWDQNFWRRWPGHKTLFFILMIKILILAIKTGGLSCPCWFHIFFKKAFSVLGCSFSFTWSAFVYINVIESVQRRSARFVT